MSPLYSRYNKTDLPNKDIHIGFKCTSERQNHVALCSLVKATFICHDVDRKVCGIARHWAGVQRALCMCVCYWINTTVMGCLQSRSGPQIQREVASAPDMADGFCDPAPPAPTDPRLPLSALQVFKLKKSWKGIKRCMEATGVEMFIR